MHLMGFKNVCIPTNMSTLISDKYCMSDGVTLHLRQTAVIENNDTSYLGKITETKLKTHLWL